MSRLEKGSSPPRLTPGNDFKFRPKLGSGSVLSVTRVPTTVPGTSGLCHCVTAKPAVEMDSPGDLSAQEDCICQLPWREKVCLPEAVSAVTGWAKAERKRDN